MPILERLKEDVYDPRYAPPVPWPGFGQFIVQAPPGLILEFGVASGLSLNHIAQIVAPRPVFGFDWFQGLPEYWKPGCPQGTFACETPEQWPDNVRIVNGLFQETLDQFLAEHCGPVGFVNMDADLYSSTAFVLSRIEDRFIDGTIVYFDEIQGASENFDHEGRAFAECLERTGFGYQVMTRSPGEGCFFRMRM